MKCVYLYTHTDYQRLFTRPNMAAVTSNGYINQGLATATPVILRSISRTHTQSDATTTP